MPFCKVLANCRIYTLVAVLLTIMATPYAMEIRPAAGVALPLAKSSIERTDHGIKSEIKQSTDLQFEGDLEFLFSAQFAPIRYGLGLGYRSETKKGSTDIAPATLPIWVNLTFGSINEDQIFSPYATARLGYAAAMDFSSPWWEKPLNYMIYAGVGCVFPYRIGLEVGYDYTSVLKSYEHKKQEFRISSGKLIARISIGFEFGVKMPALRTTIHNDSEEEENSETQQEE